MQTYLYCGTYTLWLCNRHTYTQTVSRASTHTHTHKLIANQSTSLVTDPIILWLLFIAECVCLVTSVQMISIGFISITATPTGFTVNTIQYSIHCQHQTCLFGNSLFSNVCYQTSFTQRIVYCLLSTGLCVIIR